MLQADKLVLKIQANQCQLILGLKMTIGSKTPTVNLVEYLIGASRNIFEHIHKAKTKMRSIE
jgi:hypothetical protein